MLHVKLKGKDVKISWHHVNDHKDPKTGEIIKPPKRGAHCFIDVMNDEATSIAKGTGSLRVPNGANYNKEVARKETLRRALNDTGTKTPYIDHTPKNGKGLEQIRFDPLFSKSERTAIWEAYFNRFLKASPVTNDSFEAERVEEVVNN